MYDRFSDKGAHSTEWSEIAKNFLKLAFAGDRRKAKCLCNRCRNRRILSKYEMVTLLSIDLYRTTWCGTSIKRCRHPQPLSRMEAMMRTEWMT
jgi:hypothetical protein